MLGMHADCSTMRLLHYDRLHAKEPAEVQQHMPAHTDSSVLTVAPKGSMPGLLLRCFHDGQWVEAEAQLQPGQALVFAGDMLSAMISHVLPGLLHFPSVDTMLQQAKRHLCDTGIAQFRCSAPFFLRPRPEVMINPSRVPLTPQVQARLEYGCSEADFAVSDLDNNVNNMRDNLPWKRSHLYYRLPRQ
eukprot:TRINITY_DN49734_c0_g1_i5.p1 TRINITY_DN49734_c0_g1~~TRINITY_DN49734_c0_g1_i5.p1  ORF type:complete len:188 (+),score=48.16 TRINITY_DN49734_c0_g1_i5:236-799(+)